MFYDRFNRPPRRQHFSDSKPSMTIQAAAHDCDINMMVERYRMTGSFHGVNAVPSASPQYGDFSELPSYQDALQSVIMAQDMFAGLPAVVRERFANNPAKMMDFLADSANFDEAVKLGLCEPRPAPALPEPPGPVTS